MTSGGNSFNDFPESQLTKFRAEPVHRVLRHWVFNPVIQTIQICTALKRFPCFLWGNVCKKCWTGSSVLCLLGSVDVGIWGIATSVSQKAVATESQCAAEHLFRYYVKVIARINYLMLNTRKWRPCNGLKSFSHGTDVAGMHNSVGTNNANYFGKRQALAFHHSKQTGRNLIITKN